MNFKFAKLLAIIDLNTLFYLLGKIPIIKYLGFNKLIKKANVKSKLAFIGVTFKMLSSFLIEIIFPWMVTVFLFNRILKVDDVSAFYKRVIVYILLFCVMDVFDKPSFLSDHKNAYIFMGIMGVNPDVYYKNKIINSILTTVLVHVFIAYMIFKNWTIAFTILFLKIACNLLSNVIYLNYIKRNNKMASKLFRRVIFFIVISIAALVAFTKYEIILSKSILYITSVPSIAISVLLFIFLMRFKYYNKIKMVMANSETFKAGFIATTGMTEDYKELSNFKSEGNLRFLNENKNMGMSSYIEKAFKFRFKDVIRSQFIAKLNGIIFLAILYIIFFKLGVTQVKDFNGFVTFGIVIILTAGYANNYLQICFRNIDLPFLYHKLFSQKEIEKSLNIRLKHIASRVIPNFIVALISIAIIGLIIRVNFQFEIIPKVIAIYFCILLTREMWEIMIYYLLCPYSSDLSNKSVLSKALQFVMSALIGFCFIGGFEIQKLFYIAITLFVITIIAFIFSKKFFARTFKIRY